MPRDGSGNYTLPAGNPFVTGTTISSSTMNNTLTDIATALTGSLSRSGLGGMLVAFSFQDGTVGSPGITWASETSSGFYRAGSNDWRAVIGGTAITQWTATRFTVMSGGLTVTTGGATITAGGLTVSAGGGTITGGLTVDGVNVLTTGAGSCEVISASAQSFSSGSSTKVNFPTTVNDSLSGITSSSPFKYTVQTSQGGWYTVFCEITLNAAASQSVPATILLEILKNGSAAHSVLRDWVPAIGGGIQSTPQSTSVAICRPLNLIATDFIEIRLTQTNSAGNAVTLSGFTTQNYCVLTKRGGV